MALVFGNTRETDTQLLDLFELHGRNAQHAGALLRDLLADFPERPHLARELKACEHEGDRLTQELIRRLRCGGARPPMDASDGHALATALDDIVDLAEQAADWLVLYAVEAPMEQADRLAGVLVATTEEVTHALATLRSGEDAAPHVAEIHRLEDDGDRVYRDAVASLFADGIDPMVVIRWKDIFESIEGAIDACETVAHVLEGIALKPDR